MAEPMDSPRRRVVRFGDVVRQVKSSTTDPHSLGLSRVVGLDHLDPGSLELRRWDDLNELPDGTSFTRVFRRGQVLFGKRRSYQRKVAVAGFDGICSGDILVFEPTNNELLPEFLPYVVQSDGFFDHALGTSAGSLSPRTKWQELAKYEFQLPTTAEQAEVAELLGVSDTYRSRLDRAIDAAEALLDSLVAEACSSASASVRLADRVDVLLGRQRHPRYATGEHMLPYMRAANVKDGYLDLSSVLQMNFDQREQATYRLQAGDVLVSEGCGNVNEVGANAIWRGELPGVVCFQKALIRLRAMEGASDTAFLGYWARHAFRSGMFKSIARGTNIWHVSAERTCELPFPDLSVVEQRRIADALDVADRTRQAAIELWRSADVLHRRLAGRLLTEADPSVQ
jgi:type I restriction enzyme, S subunit